MGFGGDRLGTRRDIRDAIYVADSTARTALTGLRDGQLVVEVDTNQVYSWDAGTTSWIKIGGSLSPSEVNDTNTVDHTVTGGVLTSDVQYQDTNTSAISDDASGLKVDVQYQDTNTAAISDDAGGLKVDVQYQDSNSVNLSDDASGVKADVNYQDSDTVSLSDDASGLKAEVIWPDYSNIYFVGKHGNDANDGLSPEKAKLTFSSAISAASAGDCVFCYDAGVYAEDITCVDDVDIFAQNATLQLGNGTQDQITLADNTVTFKKITRTAGGNAAILLSNASGYARLNVELIEDSGAGITIRSTSTNMAVIIVDQLYVNGGGTAIADFTSGGQHIHLKVKDIYLNSNNAVAVSCTNSSEIYGEIQHISPTGGATGTTALDINAGTVSIYSHSIEAATAYDVEAGATLNILTQEIIGTELNDGTVIGREANTLRGEVTFDTFPITPSDAPDADYEVANKKYVDDRIDGFKPKAAVRAASTANVNISNELESGDSLDGVTLTTGDRVLLKDQTDASENGIYIVPASGPAARSTDFDETTPVDEINGAWVAVQEGTENEGSICIQYGTVTTVGTDDIDFTLKASISDLVAGDGIDISGSTVSSDVDDSTIGINGSSKLEIKDSSITNSKVAAGAAIEESKLNLDNPTADAIHDNVSGEINAITEKTEPVDEDLLLIEDSEASYAKKKLQLANLATAEGSEIEVTETGHGFSILDAVYHDGSNWQLAQADSESTLATHVVKEVVDTDTLSLIQFGKIEANSHGLTPGDYHYLSTSSAGDSTTTEPTTGYSCPLFYVLDANNVLAMVYRPNAIDDGVSDPEIVYLKDVKANNTAGGGNTGGSYAQRTLNTTENSQSWASLSANRFTLSAGKYRIRAHAPGYAIGLHKAKLVEDPAGSPSDALIGTAENSGSGDAVQSRSFIEGIISPTSSTTYEIQHRGSATNGSTGYGIQSNFGENEVYTIVEIERLGDA